MKSNKKIAIVYDWIDKWGGVERLLIALYQIFPKAIFFTSSSNLQNASWAININIKQSFMQGFPDIIKKNRILSLPFYPFAFESFDFNQFDIVISVTSSFAKAVVTKPGTLHICILLTPNRFLWVLPKEYLSSNFKKFFLHPYLEYLKQFDKAASWRPDKIISISQNVADRCKKYYKRKSEVIYPPFDIQYWENIKDKIPHLVSSEKVKINKQYYLIVSRMEKYKKIDLVIKVFNELHNQKLVIVGIGSEENKLKKLANNNISFLDKVTDIELAKLYSNAQALIMPQEEDFGYVSLEAQFFGCPVIAYRKGGAIETVIEEKTGLFFNAQTSDNLVAALEQFHTISYNLQENTLNHGLENVSKYSKEIFIKKILKACNIIN